MSMRMTACVGAMMCVMGALPARAGHSAPEIHQFFGPATINEPPVEAVMTAAHWTATPRVTARAGDVVYLPVYIRALHGDIEASVAGFGYAVFASGDTASVNWHSAMAAPCFSNPTQHLGPQAGDRSAHSNNGPGVLFQTAHGAIRGAGDAEIRPEADPCYLGYMAVEVVENAGGTVEFWFSVPQNAAISYAMSNATEGIHNTVAFGWDARRSAPDSHRFQNESTDVLGVSTGQHVSLRADATIVMAGVEDLPDESDATAMTVESDDGVGGRVIGADDMSPVTIDSGDDGTTLTLGEPEDPMVTVTATGVDPGWRIDLTLGDDGLRRVMLVDGMDTQRAELTVNGADGAIGLELDVRDGVFHGTVVVGGRRLNIICNRPAIGLSTAVRMMESGDVEASVTTSESQTVSALVQDGAADMTWTFDFTDDAHAGAARRIDGAPGLDANLRLDAAVSISIDGRAARNAVTVRMTYRDEDVTDGRELDLRLFRRDNPAVDFAPAGVRDVGPASPTTDTGDYGVNSVANEVWARMTQLGEFAVGSPRQPAITAAGGVCGAPGGGGLLSLAAGAAMFLAGRRRRRAVRHGMHRRRGA